MDDYSTINHTADIGIQLEAPDLKTLFKQAALAMFDQMVEKAELPKKPRKKVIRIELKAGNLEELLVNWLAELLSLSDSKEVVFREVEIVDLTVNRLKGIAVGIPRKHFTFKTEIKAVTYHGLRIVFKNKKYSAQIIFDV